MYKLYPDVPLHEDLLPVGLYRTTPDGRILYANQAMADLLGYPDPMALRNISAPDLYVDVADRERLRILAQQRPVVRSYEVQLRRSDGGTLWVELNLRAYGNGSVVTHYEGVIVDITQRRLAEAALWDSDRRLRVLIDQMPAVLWATDVELRFTLSLGAGLGPLALKPNEVVGRRIEEFFETTDPGFPPVAAHHRALLGESIEFEMPWASRVFRAFVEPLRDPDSGIVGTIGTALDVTEARGAERALRRTVSLLESTLESTADGILVVDLEGRVVLYNQRFARLWNIPEELLLRGDDGLLLQFVLDQLEDPDAFLERVSAVYSHPEDESCDELRFKDGRVVERYSVPQTMDGAPVGRVWSFRDLTRERRAESKSLRRA